MINHRPHTCYHCSAIIGSKEPETQVPGVGYPVRYMHESEEDCRNALNRIPVHERPGDPEDDAETLYTGVKDDSHLLL